MSELMTSPLRIALVAEGVTDYVVLNAIIQYLLQDRNYDLTLLQPEGSVAFSGAGHAGIWGGGWKGVYHWCQQNAENLPLRETLFQTYDILILHLDADVGQDPNEEEWPVGLPCHKSCPPANAQTDALREIALNWLGLTHLPPKMVFCTPSQSTESWIVFLFCPDDRELNKYRETWECYPNPAGRLSQQPKAIRFQKKRRDYEAKSQAICQRWPELAVALSQARRFEAEFLGVLG